MHQIDTLRTSGNLFCRARRVVFFLHFSLFILHSLSVTAQAPTINTQPINASVNAGGNATFSVNATGTITAYQWQVSSNGGLTYTDITAAGVNPTYAGWTTNTLTLSGVPIAANGTMYRCQVFGSATSTIETFTTSGSGTWVCPAGVTSVTIQCWGAGGSGGGQNAAGYNFGGGGGGGGAFASSNLSVNPGSAYTYFVGSGGIGTSNTGLNGGDTYFGSNLVLAKGGNGGQKATPSSTNWGGAGGLGGLASQCVGTIVFSGGDGFKGQGTGLNPYSGGGGGGAGTSANGSPAYYAGGSGGSVGGGKGGDGAYGNQIGCYTGGNGLSYGGGGGGARENGACGGNGGYGANGAIKILYNASSVVSSNAGVLSVTAPPTVSTSASPSIINCGESATLTASSTSTAQPCIKADLPATLQNGLVGYWPFCGNANDASGNTNNGTVNGATLTTDRFGNANSAYSFDGNDWIGVSHNPSFNLPGNGDFSFSAWIQTSNAVTEETIISKGHGGGQNQPDVYIFSKIGSQIGLELASVPNAFWNYSANTISVNNWNSVVAIYNSVNNQVKFYINGVLGAVSSYPLLPTSNNDLNQLFFGKQGYGCNCNFFSGKIDDIAIYNRALTASEIQQLYTLGNVNYSWSTGATTPSITVSPAQTTSYSVTATNSAGSTTSSVTVNVADSLTWTGALDTDWHKPCNWSPQFVPKCCNNVSVPLTTNQPIVSGVAAAEDLTIYTTNGAQVTVNNGANLQIADCPTTVTSTACPSLAVITTTAISGITQTTAISGGTISYQGASPITARGVCWGTTTNPTLANSFTTNGTGTGVFTSNLTGLVGGTTYYVRAFATNSSGTSYGNQLTFVAVNPQPAYPANSVFCASGPTLVIDVTNPTTGKTWMDRNLGATQAATSSTDAAAYGDLYQWGRGNDGHQCRNSATTTTLSAIDQPGNANFILSPNAPYDWRSPQNSNLWQGVNGVNNPCPSGYRLPTTAEQNSERLSWSSNNASGAFSSVLKLTMAGFRVFNTGQIADGGLYGDYWSSSFTAPNGNDLDINSSNAGVGIDYNSGGYSVRCIKDASAIPASIGTLNCGSSIQTGTLISGTAANGVSVSVPYTGGNMGSYTAQTIASTGVSGLTATLNAGALAYGTGALSLTISGTPSTSGSASFSLTIGGQNCTFTLPVQIALAAQYPAGSVFCASGPTAIVDVTNPTTGKTWMDRNLGATQAATSATDAAAYGDLYQWGRGNDGHQCRNSTTTTSLSSSDQPGNANFIVAPNAPYDWRSPQNANLWQGVNGVNNPCPTGYRLPTNTELNAERLTWSVNSSTGAFSSSLKWTVCGYRYNVDGAINNLSALGHYWSSTIDGTNVIHLAISSTNAYMYSNYRSGGFTVRCIKN